MIFQFHRVLDHEGVWIAVQVIRITLYSGGYNDDDGGGLDNEIQVSLPVSEREEASPPKTSLTAAGYLKKQQWTQPRRRSFLDFNWLESRIVTWLNSYIGHLGLLLHNGFCVPIQSPLWEFLENKKNNRSNSWQGVSVRSTLMAAVILLVQQWVCYWGSFRIGSRNLQRVKIKPHKVKNLLY